MTGGYTCGARARDVRFADDRRALLAQFARFLRLVIMEAIAANVVRSRAAMATHRRAYLRGPR